MARPDSALSLELERSMNMQVRVETFEEHLRHAGVIDELDDERRVKSFNLNKWNEDMQKSFSKTRAKILKLTDLSSMKKALEDLDKKINEFNETYFGKRKQIDALEVQYEALDDEVRVWLLEYAVSCREKLKIENSNIEKKLIKENIGRKRGKEKKMN
ncbi:MULTISPECIES: hypothetical protein [Psychrilyobacter]|uniref:Uncharacterized protein n=1 Tax=Psychrilyobacter piezotolerans TaxID=2293438 RepID=A0ABX9KJ78_9FUSO|nr:MULTISPECIES: hypothetical protein [Psychrilyobacter]MCS5421882.1 hypothetical protein [Psychrilyobacter sp. S5]NDI76963.1 hypothetical protein [Psychrilyobacter piezotolerans]RDE64583.1 hypothetical protein DV867_03315 [Psychrilyobacter sp. S5]REI42395.1 hypothetical protein DYH56_03315 [Psychrilyobacter piezotolerans]